MLDRKIKGPCEVSVWRPSTAQEPKDTANKCRGSSLAVTAETAAYFVSKMFDERPETMDRLARKAIELRKRGFRVSVTGLCEWLRIESVNITGGCSPFRVNNNIKASLARELMRRYPELEGAFETRRARCDEMFSDVTSD